MRKKDHADFDWTDLQPGDALIYWESSLVDWLITLKTWTYAAHVEGYVGAGLSVASRNWIGVNRYRLRKSGLVAVRRPLLAWDINRANLWFENRARGQKYDFKGLLCYTLAVRAGSSDRMYCSEFLTRWYRAGGLQPFDSDWDADRTPPAFYLVSPTFTTIWRKPGLFPLTGAHHAN